MLTSISAECADHAYCEAVSLFKQGGEIHRQSSRCGITLEVPRVVFAISDSRRRYVQSRLPAINPAFAIAEVVWILNGRDDARFVNYFNRSLPKFAGGVKYYHGAYGRRLRNTSGMDQLARAADALRSQADSRQVVLQIWDCQRDFPASNGAPAAPDVPCNVTSMLKVRHNRLEWTQVLRSNDLFRGVPYNFFQFMTLQEIVAGWIGIDPGGYCHLSDSLHIYESDLGHFECTKPGPIEAVPVHHGMSYEETIQGFKTLAIRIDKLISEEPTSRALLRNIDQSGLRIYFRNMLCVLYAEVARRRKDSAIADQLIERCEDRVLALLFKRWCARFAAIPS